MAHKNLKFREFVTKKCSEFEGKQVDWNYTIRIKDACHYFNEYIKELKNKQ